MFLVSVLCVVTKEADSELRRLAAFTKKNFHFLSPPQLLTLAGPDTLFTALVFSSFFPTFVTAASASAASQSWQQTLQLGLC